MLFMNALRLAYHHSLIKVTTVFLTKVTFSSQKGTVVMLRTVQLVNKLRLSNKWPVSQQVSSS